MAKKDVYPQKEKAELSMMRAPLIRIS